MDPSTSLQQYIFDQIKSRLSPNKSMVDEVADLLSVSNDSAYRRIRGEKLLDIQEAIKLCRQYGISIDALMGLASNTINFKYNFVDEVDFHFHDYLKYVQEQLELINQFDQKELLFAAKDIPFFHYFQFPGLTYFKSYFWMKIILGYGDYQDKLFDIKDAPQEVMLPAKGIWDKYMKVPSIEIWSDETINVTLNQIEYCWDCGHFNSPDEAIHLCEEMKHMMKHIENQAKLGNKYHFLSEATKEGSSFKLYYNEVTISDNTILFDMDNQLVTYITHNLFNILTTSDAKFCEQTSAFFHKIISKSILISQVSEKERSIFFRKGIQKINELIAKIK